MENTERITTTFIGREFGWDTLADVNWAMLSQNVKSANHVLDNLAKFPRANIEACERMAEEGSAFLLKGPIEYWIS